MGVGVDGRAGGWVLRVQHARMQVCVSEHVHAETERPQPWARLLLGLCHPPCFPCVCVHAHFWVVDCFVAPVLITYFAPALIIWCPCIDHTSAPAKAMLVPLQLSCAAHPQWLCAVHR